MPCKCTQQNTGLLLSPFHSLRLTTNSAAHRHLSLPGFQKSVATRALLFNVYSTDELCMKVGITKQRHDAGKPFLCTHWWEVLVHYSCTSCHMLCCVCCCCFKLFQFSRMQTGEGTVSHRPAFSAFKSRQQLLLHCRGRSTACIMSPSFKKAHA